MARLKRRQQPQPVRMKGLVPVFGLKRKRDSNSNDHPRRRKRRRTSGTKPPSNTKGISCKKSRDDLLTTSTFKATMQELMSQLQKPNGTGAADMSAIQKLENKVKRASLSTTPGRANKNSRDRLTREVLRQQSNTLNTQIQSPSVPNIAQPYRAQPPYKSSLETGEPYYDPGTKSWSRTAPKRLKAGGLMRHIPTPIVKRKKDKRTVRRNLMSSLEEDEEEGEEDEEEEYKTPSASANRAEKKNFKRSKVMKRVQQQDGDVKVAESLYPMMNNQLAENGLLDGKHDPVKVIMFFSDPNQKKVPEGIDSFMYGYAVEESTPAAAIMIKDNSSDKQTDISAPYIKHIKALQALQIDFRKYYQALERMSDEELVSAMKLVNRLPKGAHIGSSEGARLEKVARSTQTPRRTDKTTGPNMLRLLRGAVAV